mgnify:CR=1 FL=1
MADKPGLKPDLKELSHMKDRLSFLYVEKCQINRDSNALVLKDVTGEVMVPSAQISVLLLGPGTTITHRAMELAGDSGVSIVWVGENSVRYYASGRPLTTSSRLLMRQAEYASNRQKHLEVVRRMYRLRFPDEDLTGQTLQQLRGKEGSRMKKTYREQSIKWNVPWSGRNYDPNDFSKGDPVNQALSAGNVCLYGVAHAVIAAMGLSPGLGFIHIGHEKSFVYDLADLYKADTTIPIAFELASQSTQLTTGIASEMRRRMRDVIYEKKIIERMVNDLRFLFTVEGDEDVIPEYDICLWNNYKQAAKSGVLYE